MKNLFIGAVVGGLVVVFTINVLAVDDPAGAQVGPRPEPVTDPAESRMGPGPVPASDPAEFDGMSVEQLHEQLELAIEESNEVRTGLKAVRVELYKLVMRLKNDDPEIKKLKAELVRIKAEMDELAMGKPESAAKQKVIEETEKKIVELAKRQELLRQLIREKSTEE